jgi:hypothetical protein
MIWILIFVAMLAFSRPVMQQGSVPPPETQAEATVVDSTVCICAPDQGQVPPAIPVP